MNHLTDHDIDSLLERSDQRFSLHLGECNECSDRFRRFQSLDATLRTLPVEKPSSHFATDVMQRLRIGEPVSLGWALMKNLAPIFALSLIIGVVFFALKTSGALGDTQHGEFVRSSQEWNAEISRNLSVGVGAYTAWVNKYLSFGGNSVGLALFVAIFFGAVALLDKFVIMPVVRRRLNLLP